MASPSLQLTSYERMRRYAAAIGQTAQTSGPIAERMFGVWIAAVSDKIEAYCNRRFLSESRTEYFDVTYNRDEYWIKSPPVTTLTSVYEDSSGEWDGSQSEISDCIYGSDGLSVILPYRLTWTARKGLRIIYTGGLAASGVRSVFSVTGASGAFTVGYYVRGGTSGALGIVRAWATPALTVEVINGVFEAAETLTAYATAYDVDTAPSAGTTAVLASKTTTALCEAYPGITAAAEVEVRYMWKHQLDFETTGTNADQTTIRRGSNIRQYPLLPETMDLLNHYVVATV